MQVEKAHPGAMTHHDGQPVYFCSDHCRERFDADAAAFLGERAHRH
jgi:Cu+-exporting ATPase